MNDAGTPAIGHLHAEALDLNKQVVYVEGHGTRAYVLTNVDLFDDGIVLFDVRPLSGGMEWSFDRRAFGTKPFVPAEKCGCEADSHFLPQRTLHGYMEVTAGSKRAKHIGAICDECATTCMANYLI